MTKMAGEDAPNKVKRANETRYREFARLARIKRRLGKKMQEEEDDRKVLYKLLLTRAKKTTIYTCRMDVAKVSDLKSNVIFHIQLVLMQPLL